MLSLFVKGKKKSKVAPRALYNVEITLTGWEGPFESKAEIHRMSSLLKKYEGVGWRSRVLETGELIWGKQKGLHTYFGKLDVQGVGFPHVHFKGGEMNYIIREKHNKIFFSEIVSGYESRRELGMKPRSPRYTLQGLYATLPDNKLNTKVRFLEEVLKEHEDYDFESIAKRNEIKVKLLESAYKRMVSSQ